ncbi:MAG: gamma-glutamyltransferase, partial [Terracidiphilus sp.]
MRRRTFIQTLPLAAAASAVTMQSEAAGLGQSGSTSTELPKFQPADAERFIRPDVHAGDRPSGASFATRSPALGLSGAAGTA